HQPVRGMREPGRRGPDATGTGQGNGLDVHGRSLSATRGGRLDPGQPGALRRVWPGSRRDARALPNVPPHRPRHEERMSHPSDPADTGAGLSRLAAISAALRPHDPGAQVALDPDHGSVQVLTVLDPEEVDRILA